MQHAVIAKQEQNAYVTGSALVPMYSAQGRFVT